MQRLFKRADSPNWYVNLGAGVYKSTGCRDFRAAQSRAAQLERALHAPPDQAPDSPPFADALDRAVADRKVRGRADGTLGMWEIKGQHLSRILGATTPLHEIDAKAVDAYTAQRLEEGAARSTIGKELGVLRVTLKLARRRNEFPHDPAAVLPQGWETDYQPRTRALSPDEMRRVIADLMDDALPMTRGRAGPARLDGSRRSRSGPAPATSSYDRTRHTSMRERAARVAWILATSGRWSESDRARPEDVDWKTGLVLVRGSKTAGSWRNVPILPPTAPLLRLALDHGRDEGPLFLPWTNVRRDLHAVCRRLGIPPVSPNDLRRSTGRFLRDAGVEPHLIAAVLGHTDARMVERVYGKLPPDELKRLLEARVGKIAPLLPTGTTAKRAQRRRAGGSR